MKRVGELYEVVVFTASVSKVSQIVLPHQRTANVSCSMVILCWISSTFITWFITDSSEKVVTTIKATTSRISHKWAEIYEKQLSSTTRPHPTSSTHNTLFQSAVGSLTPMTTSSSISFLSWKISQAHKSETSVLFSMLDCDDAILSTRLCIYCDCHFLKASKYKICIIADGVLWLIPFLLIF